MIIMVPYTLLFSSYGYYAYVNVIVDDMPFVRLNVIVVLCFFATVLGSAVVHFMAWRAVHAHISAGLMAFSQITGSLSGLLTGGIRLGEGSVYKAVRDKWRPPEDHSHMFIEHTTVDSLSQLKGRNLT